MIKTPSLKLDTRMLRRLQKADEGAWQHLVETWSRRLYSYIRYNVPTAEDAEDVTNETWAGAARGILTFDGRVAISTWLYTIAQHKIADWWRSSRPATTLNHSFPNVDNTLNLGLYEALARLPDQTRQALLLRYREGLSVGEVADVLGRTYKATESLLSRGRSLLRVALDDPEEHHEAR